MSLNDVKMSTCWSSVYVLAQGKFVCALTDLKIHTCTVWGTSSLYFSKPIDMTMQTIHLKQLDMTLYKLWTSDWSMCQLVWLVVDSFMRALQKYCTFYLKICSIFCIFWMFLIKLDIKFVPIVKSGISVSGEKQHDKTLYRYVLVSEHRTLWPHFTTF